MKEFILACIALTLLFTAVIIVGFAGGSFLSHLLAPLFLFGG